MTSTPPAAVRSYLDELGRLLADSPDRDLVIDGVARHIEDALAGGPLDAARVQAVLDDLGDPAVIAADLDPTREGRAARAPFLDRRGGKRLTVAMLAVGGIVIPVAGWIVGVGLLWLSGGWRRADKFIGTFAIPVVLVAVVAIGSLVWKEPSVGTGFGFPSHLVLLVLFPLLDIAVAVFLLLRFRESS